MMVLAIWKGASCYGIFKSVRVSLNKISFACEKGRLKIKRYCSKGNRGVLFWKELIFHVAQSQTEINMMASDY